jgi:hypothetical protein
LPSSTFDSGHARAKDRQLPQSKAKPKWVLNEANDELSDEEPLSTNDAYAPTFYDSYFSIKLLQDPYDDDECPNMNNPPLEALPKSIGSPTVRITVTLGKHQAIWEVCIDTGSERTVCTLPYAQELVGDRLEFLLQHPANMPNL